jgi:hypothetical protein
MFDVSGTIDGTGCAICGELRLAERYVRVRGGRVSVFCSRECLGEDARARWLRARALWARVARHVFLAATLLVA